MVFLAFNRLDSFFLFPIHFHFLFDSQFSVLSVSSVVKSFFCGGMAEWSMAAVLKTVSPKGDVGSNPTPSARNFAAQNLPAANGSWLLAGRRRISLF